MKMISRRSLLAAGALTPLARRAAADSRYPTRTVTVISPFAAGGQSDSVGRVMNNHFQRVFGQPFVMENRVGAGGTLGTQYVVRSEPDGYNLLFGTTSAFAIAPYVYNPKPYDPIANLAPIVVLTEASTVLIASEKSGFRSLGDLVQAAKKDPGRITVASAGIGSFPHVFAEVFSALLGLQLTHVPYRGGGPAMNDILGGQVDVFFEVITTAAPQIQSGRAHGLFVSGSARSALLPDVPTATELGYPGLSLTSWSGLAAAAGTPATIVDILNKEANVVLQSVGMKDLLTRLGIGPVGGSPESMAERMVQEASRYRDIISNRGITVQ
jgi:tripartite-type tricarboxylate transporter receptor subunit TctC